MLLRRLFRGSPRRMRNHSHTTEAASLFARLMAIVSSQLGEIHFRQGEDVVTLLRAPLHASLRVDVQKLEPGHAFPLSRKIAKEHLLQMLAIKVHPIEDSVAAERISRNFWPRIAIRPPRPCMIENPKANGKSFSISWKRS